MRNFTSIFRGLIVCAEPGLAVIVIVDNIGRNIYECKVIHNPDSYRLSVSTELVEVSSKSVKTDSSCLSDSHVPDSWLPFSFPQGYYIS